MNPPAHAIDPPLPPFVQRGFSLARLTTVRTGGPAEWFARVGEESQLLDLLRWASEADVAVAVVGSGSNLLVADAGAPGLVVKLEGELGSIERVGERGLLCGGGARLPAVAAHAARAGLSGIEFGVNIPGTVGGAVRMNANAYGGELARTLEWAEVVGAREVQRSEPVSKREGEERRVSADPEQRGGIRIKRRVPADLGFAYRSSDLRPGEVVARARFALDPAPPAQVKATLADLRARRHEAQPQGIKTFGSTFKNPDQNSEDGRRAGGRTAGLLLSDAGCNGLAVGAARFAPKHANFIENTGAATTAEIVALMAVGRRRVLERFGVSLEPEVQTLGPVRFPW
ncbi:MAG TPA: UDP-N-acetylmuramate dehydrogenase [Solirubrobacteraceae bacterium]|jgi:UDP-N-acetylenolpyruvoylglucosamine reductase|nr:UDP-N-acetylmuramate dehydrogenase [Solirubrobacteraceae bacterium]